MSTESDIQTVIDDFNATADLQVVRLRALAALVKALPSSHKVTFSNGESVSTNLMHGHADQVEQQIARLTPRVTYWQ